MTHIFIRSVGDPPVKWSEKFIRALRGFRTPVQPFQRPIDQKGLLLRHDATIMAPNLNSALLRVYPGPNGNFFPSR